MFALIQKFSCLSRTRQKTFLEAYCLLGFFRLAILTLPFKWLTSSLIQCPAGEPVSHSLDIDQRPMVFLIAESIRKAALHTPWDSACLVQSLAAQRMLQRRNLPGMFYLGLQKGTMPEEPLKAHAWSQSGDIILTGGAGSDAFKVISVFTWGQL